MQEREEGATVSYVNAHISFLLLVFLTANVYPVPGATQGRPTTPPRLTEPALPTSPYRYTNALPYHFTNIDHPESIAATDNTPIHNPTTDDGATLGRVLFYDTRLSLNGQVSCGSCHQQRNGFSDPRQFSIGFDGQVTRRHSMSLTNARYYLRGRFFWDERAETLEAQVLAPIHDSVEMGLPLEELKVRLSTTPFYRLLFTRAFGTSAVTQDRVARALAQFVRALVSHRSAYDVARSAGLPGSDAFVAHLTPAQRLGHQLFVTDPGSEPRGAGCGRCHVTDAQISLSPRNIGLSPGQNTDYGAGDERFKAPSLRNIEITQPYMHDGRFATLREVIEHYNSQVAPHPFLDMRLLDRRVVVTGGAVEPIRLNLTDLEINGLLAFLAMLTDTAFLTDPRFSDPFTSTSDEP